MDTGSRISVNGGDTTDRTRGGGGGSGGSIRLVGGSIENNGDLQAHEGGLEPGGMLIMMVPVEELHSIVTEPLRLEPMI